MVGPPSEKDWQNANIFRLFLRRFYKVTLRFSGSLYITSNRYLEDIVDVKGHLDALSVAKDSTICSMARSMRTKFDKYWGNSDRVNHMLFLGTVLDPRYKLEYVEHCLQFIYSDESDVASLVRGIEDTLRRLFKEYTNEASPSRSSSSNTNISVATLNTRGTQTTPTDNTTGPPPVFTGYYKKN